MKTLTFIVFLGLLLPFSAWSQEDYTLELVFKNQEDKDNIRFAKTHASKLSIESELHRIQMQLYAQSYAYSEMDTTWKGKQLIVRIDRGPVAAWNALTLDSSSLPDYVPDAFRLRYQLEKNPFRIEDLHAFYDKILSDYENEGYPFASIQLSEVRMDKEMQLSGVLKLSSGPRITMDSLIIHGNARVNKSYLRYYLGIHRGDVYRQSRVDNISKKLRDLSFLSEEKPYRIQVIGEFARVHIYVKDRPVSLFNGLVAFGSENGNSTKLVFTGNFQIKLVNAFEHGSQIEAKWNKPPGNSQQLFLYGDYPYAFKTPFGAQYTLELDRQDSSYLNVHHKPGLRLYFSARKSIGVYYSIVQSQLLNPTTFSPELNDFRKSNLGIDLLWQDLDHPFFPTKGYSLKLGVEGGQKSLLVNTAFDQALYDSLNMEQSTATFLLDASAYYPFSARHVVFGKCVSKGVFSEDLLTNEFFKLGGFEVLRGFDEHFFASPLYTVTSLEYHFHLDARSYLFLFYDQGFLADHTLKLNQYPSGFGTGMNFGSKAGIFSVSFALGKEYQKMIQLRNTKVHFGYYVRF